MSIKERTSLTELIITITLTTLLVTIAVPAYASHRIRSKVFFELEKLKSITQYISNDLGTISYSFKDFENIPSNFHIEENGAIVLNTNDIVANSSIALVPILTSGAIIWNCIGRGLNQSQIPEPCKVGSLSKQKLVDSLYDPTTDTDIFTFIRFGRDDLTANCTKYRCTITEINGKRWLAQYIDQLNTIQLYKEDSDYFINLREDNLNIDPSIVDSELLQQFVNESIQLFSN
ncbi:MULTISPECIES: hypothetical protein [unclassified Francisella]|uniref:hypothetical protein n=1 Tax=unclassified Francisella TaxID=2610885 RepID=UPI002E310C37|nr:MULTISPECIES: hypothetical protein [unclassified Francisella]MED7819272.1 hypothetical protein [Francisella sp. 19S2-4]MED7830098.1 hypothetical protein [Francisella sp. 19S2-10]